MAQIMQPWASEIQTDPEAFVEMWAYGKNQMIVWTEEFNYKVFNQNGSVAFEGQLDQKTPEGNLPLLQINCVWFHPMANGKMLYVAFTDAEVASLRVWDFATKTGTDWATGLPVARQNFHNFCWLYYNQADNKVQMAYQGKGEKSHYMTVTEAGVQTNQEVDLNNACVFAEWNSSLYAANNFGDPKTLKIFGMHADGSVRATTMKFAAESAYTIQEFGWLRENAFFMITIEGECGKSKINPEVGHLTLCLVYEGCVDNKLPEGEVEETGDNLKKVIMDPATDENNVALPDGFFMMDRVNMSLYCTCSNDNFQRFDFKQDDKAVWQCTKGQGVPKADMPNYCVSWDKESMFTFEQEKTKISVSVMSKLNPRYQYFWLLSGLTGVPLKSGAENTQSGWKWPALKDCVDLLVPK